MANFVADLKVSVGSTKQVSGLRQAAGDMVEWAVDLSPEMVERLDRRLRTAQLPTLTQMRNSQYRKVHRILAAGALRGEGEYQLLNGMLSDTESTVLSEAEIRRAEDILAKFHGSIRQ
jgi:hypothetical protein